MIKCEKCGADMVCWSDSSQKVGYRYVCSNKRKTKCSGTVDPLILFFEKTKIPFCDILAIIFCFILKLVFVLISLVIGGEVKMKV